MRTLKILLATGGLATLCFTSSWSFFHSHQTDHQTDEKNPPSIPQSSKKALEAYKLQNTLEFLKHHAPDIDLSTDIGKKRLELLIEQYAGTDSYEEITLLYEYFPESFEQNEQASLTVARAMLASRQLDTYKQIRQSWKHYEREPEQWLFLDAEALSIEGFQTEAANLLSSKSFKGDAETERLVRIALIHLLDDPKLSWKYLSEASAKDPDNPMINTYKASLLESANKHDMALSEYILAVQKDPDNPHLREQLADFYLRLKQYPEAIKILQDSLPAPSLDSIWLKTFFWNRVTLPINYKWSTGQIPDGEQKPLIEFLLTLPSGIFWDTDSFNRVTNGEHYLTSQQETFWLRLLMFLKNNKEQEALELLQQSPFQTVSWMPQLQNNLKSVLTYRIAKEHQTHSDHSLSLSTDYHSPTQTNDKEQFLNELSELSKAPTSQITTIALSKWVQDLILSKEIFSTLFLTANWDEAALKLHSLPTIPSNFPEWISLSLTQAIERNRGPSQAIQFALQQNKNPELSLLIAQLALKAKQQELAINTLKEIYKKSDLIGINASKLLSKIYLDQGDNNAAKEVILSQPALANALESKEILARIALQSGDVVTANELYSNLENESAEAKSFLARKAFADKNWNRAKSLTEQLIKFYPENNTLKDNLHKILLEEQKEKFNTKR